jgi:hypothetical protein
MCHHISIAADTKIAYMLLRLIRYAAEIFMIS